MCHPGVARYATGCLCLFATHFHELTALEKNDDGNGVQNLHVTAEADVKSNKLTMLYKVSLNASILGRTHGMVRGSRPNNYVMYSSTTAELMSYLGCPIMFRWLPDRAIVALGSTSPAWLTFQPTW